MLVPNATCLVASYGTSVLLWTQLSVSAKSPILYYCAKTLAYRKISSAALVLRLCSTSSNRVYLAREKIRHRGYQMMMYIIEAMHYTALTPKRAWKHQGQKAFCETPAL